MLKNAGSFLLNCWRVFIEHLKGWFGMGVAVKIILGTPPGTIETINLVVAGSYSVVPLNLNLTAATAPISTTNLSGSTVPLFYQYRG